MNQINDSLGGHMSGTNVFWALNAAINRNRPKAGTLWADTYEIRLYSGGASFCSVFVKGKKQALLLAGCVANLAMAANQGPKRFRATYTLVDVRDHASNSIRRSYVHVY